MEGDARARRMDTDPRCDYVFQVLATCTGLSRHQVVDDVFQGSLVGDFFSLQILFFVAKSSETYPKEILPSALFEGGLRIVN